MHVIINGQEAHYSEVVAKPGGYLLLKDGTRYTFDVVELKDSEPPKTSNPLIEVERLAYGNDTWMLGDQSLSEYLDKAYKQILARVDKPRGKRQRPRFTLVGFFCNLDTLVR